VIDIINGIRTSRGGRHLAGRRMDTPSGLTWKWAW